MWSDIRNVSWKSQDLNGSRVQTPIEVLTFSGFYTQLLINCVHNCDDHGLLDFKSAVQYMKHFIYHFTSILHGLIRNHKWPAPNVSGFIAQLVRASHRHREVTGSNAVEVLPFSSFYTQLFKLRWSWLTCFQIRSSIYDTFHITLHNIKYVEYFEFVKERVNMCTWWRMSNDS